MRELPVVCSCFRRLCAEREVRLPERVDYDLSRSLSAELWEVSVHRPLEPYQQLSLVHRERQFSVCDNLPVTS